MKLSLDLINKLTLNSLIPSQIARWALCAAVPTDNGESQTRITYTRLGADGNLSVLCAALTNVPAHVAQVSLSLVAAASISLTPISSLLPCSYVNRHRDPSFGIGFTEVCKWPIHVQISHYATVCCRRLDRIGSSGRRLAKKPTVDEVEQARVSWLHTITLYRSLIIIPNPIFVQQQILRNSMFGNTLSEVMDLQKDKFPFRKLPWIQTTLSEHVSVQKESFNFNVQCLISSTTLFLGIVAQWQTNGRYFSCLRRCGWS